MGVDKQNNGINLTSVSCFFESFQETYQNQLAYGRPALRLKMHRSAFGSQAPPGPARGGAYSSLAGFQRRGREERVRKEWKRKGHYGKEGKGRDEKGRVKFTPKPTAKKLIFCLFPEPSM